MAKAKATASRTKTSAKAPMVRSGKAAPRAAARVRGAAPKVSAGRGPRGLSATRAKATAARGGLKVSGRTARPMKMLKGGWGYGGSDH